MSNLTNNTTTIQNLITKINSLPNAGSGGVDLPTLSNEAAAADLLANKELINSSGSKVIGTMPNNGAISSTMDGISTKSITIPKGYTSGGTVSLDNTIDSEVAEQTDLISQITTALEGKAAGGGTSLDTCTVTFSTDGRFDLFYVLYTAVENNQIVAKCLKYPNDPFVLNNVLCNSGIALYAICYSQIAGWTITGTAQNLAYSDGYHTYIFKAPSVPKEECSIYLYDND